MNTPSIEQQLQNLNPPVPDPAARLRARRAALTEFHRIHAPDARPTGSRWSWKSPWLGGFATACVAVVGVSIFWLVPEEQRRIQLPAPVASQGVPAPTEGTAQAPVIPEVQTIAPTSAAARAQAPAKANDEASGSRPASRDVTADTRTLTPVAGRPLVSTSSETDVVDPNAVPPNLQKRMDVVTGGASATYGSGAAAGVAIVTAPPPASPAPPVYGPPPPPPPLAGGARRGGGGGDDELSQVTVTGSRIQASGYNSPNPIVTVTSEEMRRLGVANLRGLDPTFGERTLTMVDGRRVVVPNPPEGGDRFEHFETNAVKRVADEPESTFSIDVDTVSYSFARRVLNEGRLPAMDAVRVEEMINYFDYAWPAPTSRREPLRPTVTVSDSPWGAGKKLVHIGIKGYELPARGKPDANLVFLLDVSGSMSPADRLPLAMRSMQLLLDSLQPTDTVAIVVYAGAAGLVLPPTPARNREVIERALNSLHAGGSTAGGQGIRLAYEVAQQGFRKDGVNRILLATDGDFNVGITNRDELKGLVERERTKGIYLSVLGFGRGNYRDEVAQTLAQNGNGVAAYIDTLQEARKVLVEEASSSLFTIASDVKIQVEFNPAAVAEYRLVGYETRALKREDFNNDKVDAGDVGSGHAVTAIYEITPVGSSAQLLDERRYADGKVAAPAKGRTGEYGFLKIRYKLPGESQSRLMQQPIRQDMGVPAAVRQDVAFSTAVAGFAQLLRGGRYTGELRYDDVIRQAESARGEDEFGYRAEFVQLARKARDVRSPLCNLIQQLDQRIAEERQQVSLQLQRFGEEHPEVLAARARVASTEATRAAEVARAAAQGEVCRAESLF